MTSHTNSLVERYIKYGPYGHRPSLEGGIVFTAMYALLACILVFRAVRYSQWWMLSTLGAAAVLECPGSAIRIASHFDSQSVNAYIAQEVILVLTPAFVAAAHLTILSKVCQACGDSYIRPMKTKWMIKFFVSVDVISLLIQGAGSGLAASADLDVTPISQIISYGDIVVGGFVLQLVGYLAFNILFILFAYRSSGSKDLIESQFLTSKFKRFLIATWFSAACVVLRSIFRTVGMGVGWVGIVAATEWYFLVFDATFISLFRHLFANGSYFNSATSSKQSSRVHGISSIKSIDQSRNDYMIFPFFL